VNSSGTSKRESHVVAGNSKWSYTGWSFEMAVIDFIEKNY